MKRTILQIVLISILLCHSTVMAEKLYPEEKIKASYVFNFLRFIQWPSEAVTNKMPFKVCTFPTNTQFINAFTPVVGRSIKGQKVTLHELAHIDDIDQCHLLYISRAEKNKVSTLLPILKQSKILSVSDIHSFCETGGMIGLVRKKSKIKVEINLKEAEDSGYKISSNLLEVATIVSSQ